MVTSAARRFSLTPFAALLAVLVSAVPSHAKCDPSTDPDKSDIANARAAVAANCDCAGATSHGAYVSCAAQQAHAVLTNESCARFVKRCAAHSTCGNPGAVTCCRTTGKGTTKCSIKSSSAKCAAPRGGSACVGQVASCCDACTAGGCATTTTTTTTTSSSATSTTLAGTTLTTCPSTSTTTTLPLCDSSYPGCGFNGVCFNGHTCEVDTTSGQCACTGPPPSCGQWGIIACGGTCPAGTMCQLDNVAPPSCPAVQVCHCVAT